MDEFIRAGDLLPMMIDHARALIASRLLQITEERSRRGITGLLPQRRLQASMDAMVASPEKDFTLMELAQLCHSSVFHFSRSFSAHIGCAPFAFQRRLRVQRACAF